MDLEASNHTTWHGHGQSQQSAYLNALVVCKYEVKMNQQHMSSVIYFRHNDMQDCVIKLGKWYRTAVAEARGRFFVFFLRKLAEANAM